jgi:hypothetical protein
MKNEKYCQGCWLKTPAQTTPALWRTHDGDFYCTSCLMQEGIQQDECERVQVLAPAPDNAATAQPLPAAGARPSHEVKEPTKEETITMSTTEDVCRHDGCDKKLTARNTSGFCSTHWYDSQRKGAKPVAKKAQKKTVPAAETPHADAYLERCKGTRAMSGNAVAPLPAAGTQTKKIAIALELDEEQLNIWWAVLPFETRGMLFQHFFHGFEA